MIFAHIFLYESYVLAAFSSQKKLSYEKNAGKMLMKFTTGIILFYPTYVLSYCEVKCLTSKWVVKVVPFVSRIVAFIVKNMETIFFMFYW